MQVMTHVLPLEFGGSHAVGEDATVTCGMSTEMKKRYITTTSSSTAELKTPVWLRVRREATQRNS